MIWPKVITLSCLFGIYGTSHGMETASVEDGFPNPRQKPYLCNRTKPSFICDPDGVLSHGEAERLDILAFNLRRSTICLCSKCNSQTLGASFGIFIKYNYTEEMMNKSNPVEMAEIVRKHWQMGSCEDDIIVVVIADIKKASYTMGSAVRNAIPNNIAERIFNECIVHFENSNFYQGLESMINSFEDVLRRFQRPRAKAPPSQLNLILGVTLGIIVFLLIIVTVVLLRLRQMRKRHNFHSLVGSKTPPKPLSPSKQEVAEKKFEYQLCRADGNFKNESDSSSNDEGIDSDDESKGLEISTLTVPQFFEGRTKRQLSDVAEENEDEIASIRYAMSNSPRSSNVQTSEL